MPDVLLTLASTADAATAGYVRDLLLILLAASVVSIVSPRIRVPSIPGYLLLGAMLGSSMLGLVRSDENVRQIADLSIVLLMFTIGLHLDTGSIRSGMVSILTVGVVSTLGIALAAWPVAMAFGLSSPAALAVALAISMSSTAVVLGLLNQRREINRVHGRLCVGISLVQDLISIGVFGVLPALAVWAGIKGAEQAAVLDGDQFGRTLATVGTTALKVMAVCVMLLLSRLLLPRALKEASKNANTEALLVVATTAALAGAVVTYLLGFGSAMGAFLAGFMLSSTPFRHQLAGQLSPMRDLFLAVFFTAVGIKLNVRIALDAWWVVGLAAAAVLIVKGVIITVSTWAGGANAPTAVRTGVLLSQAGEFSLVILAQAGTLTLLKEHDLSVLIAVIVVTLVLTTPLYELALRLEGRLSRIPPARWITNPALHEPMSGGHSATSTTGGSVEDPFKDDPLPYPHRPVIIAGFGVVGRNLAEHFAAAGIPYVVIELNPSTVIRQQKLGRNFVFGDIANPDVLESAGIHAAEAVILTIPDDEAVLRACRTIRRLAPKVFVAARTTYLSRAIAATEMGADYVCVEEVVTAQDMAKQVMERLAKRLIEV